ncbi:MAG: type IV pilus modification protein PilV [Gammaproteobacteria bacterium]|nr:type IV pilus modification protein PilV [Gammaproteobacteria bacterium]
MLKLNKKQLGLSLIESMVALLVISVGLLGIAALQVTSMQQNNSALHHSQAVWIGYNIADRIRANMAQFGSYVGTDTNSTYSQDCTTGACTAAALVVADQQDWATAVQNLPGGRGTITQTAGVPDELLIRVMWDDDGTGASGIACGGGSNDLTCYSVTLNR